MIDPTQMPIARELFAQWRRARGRSATVAMRPFSRSWSALMEDAGLTSGMEIRESEHDIRGLAGEGWVQLKTIRYKPHLIDRIVIPLEVEERWRVAFGFEPPSDEEAERIRTRDWSPAMRFITDIRLNISFDELKQLDDYLRAKTGAELSVPIKERSLKIFGDEKRLDSLYANSALFDSGRLTLEMFNCFIAPEPLGWKRGAAPDGPIVILENAATWNAYCRWDKDKGLFSGVVYGGGNRFIHSFPSLETIFDELGAKPALFYFGDLDAAGLRIPRVASQRSQSLGLPEIEPHTWSYQRLIELADHPNVTQPSDHADWVDEDFEWLGELSSSARVIIEAGLRIPQEWIGWEYLSARG